MPKPNPVRCRVCGAKAAYRPDGTLARRTPDGQGEGAPLPQPCQGTAAFFPHRAGGPTVYCDFDMEDA